MLGVGTVASQGLRDLFINYHKNLDTGFGSSLEHLIESPFLIVVGWSSEKQLGAQPPVRNVDSLLGPLQRYRDGIKVVSAIYIPLDLISFPFRGKGLETMAFCDSGALLIRLLFMLLVMPVIGVDKVSKLANLVLEVDRLDFGIVQVRS